MALSQIEKYVIGRASESLKAMYKTSLSAVSEPERENRVRLYEEHIRLIQEVEEALRVIVVDNNK